MKVILKIGLYWIIFMNSMYAQSFENDMLTMQKAYADVSNLYLEMENTIWKDAVIAKEQKAKIYKKGALYLYEIEDATMLINKEYILMIDHLSKTIIYDKWTEEQAKALMQQHIPTLSDIEKNYPSIIYNGEQNNHRKYTLENKEVQLSKVEISFELKTGFMRKVRYYYNPKFIDKEVYTELKMNVIDTSPSFESSTFSEKRFVTQKDHKFRGTGKYSSYTVQSAK